jgi:hypothetical protein
MAHRRDKRSAIRAAAAAVLIFAAVAAAGRGEDKSAFSGTASLTAFNRYIFRGFRLGGGRLVVQPFVTASYAGFSAWAWGNFDTKEAATPNFTPVREGRSSYNETDVSAGYEWDSDAVSVSLGFIYYGTRYASSTLEIYAQATWNVAGEPTLAVYQDVDAYPGTYINVSWTPSLSLARDLSLDLGVSAGAYLGGSTYWRTFAPATGGYTGTPYRAFHDGMLKAGLNIALGGGWSLQPQAQYTFPLSSAAKRASDAAGGTANGPLAPVWVMGAALQLAF